MVWQICIRYPDGHERTLHVCKNREVALRYVDAIYSHGYPMHVAYVVRPVEETQQFMADLNLQPWSIA
jgi:hypothetical protein